MSRQHQPGLVLLGPPGVALVDAALVLAAVARIVVRAAAPVLAAVGGALGVHAHHVLLQVAL